MIKWFKKDRDKTAATPLPETLPIEKEAPQSSVKPDEVNPFFSRFKQGLEKTRQKLGGGIGRLLLGKKEIQSSLLEDLEERLINADVGIKTSQFILQRLHERLTRSQLADGEAVYHALKNELEAILAVCEQPLKAETNEDTPFVILMVGVNGAGKTTSIGKLTKQFQEQGKKVMLAAGDTFRAAAVEQLQVWGERNKILVISQGSGADSASVIYDAYKAAQARKVDVLIADTAGRLHTQHHLMEELKKVQRVVQKIDPEAPHELLLVLDASIGQNALSQARQFHQAIGITGIIMTKLDGTAKGGILFAIAHELRIPIRFLGVGEKIDDLRPFNASQFVDALL